MKILIVDDEELVVLSLKKCLTDLGYDVMTSNSVNDAIEKYDFYRPNLVIADINMPEYEGELITDNHEDIEGKKSGLDLVKYIKVIKKHKTPVLILSGNKNQDIIEKGFALGATDYLKKPLSLNEIGIRVKKLIGNSTTTYVNHKEKFIQNKVVGVVIPFL